MTSANRLLDEQLCFSIYKASKQFIKIYGTALEPFGLTYTQYIVLLALWEKDHQTVTDLGKMVDLDSGTLTPLLKRMATNGYVTRARLLDDERKVGISLTPKAIELEETINQQVSGCVEQLMIDQQTYEMLLKEVNALTEKIGGIVHEKNL
ncbi:MarR family transcriptional regulator [Vagococcus sp. BWB3-3]|uniref:HTH-type transcriptional regulator SarZ n=1 Tax=Vagococcus allomyrinae TaxID=2794353 RepID=A0A940P6A6_9ENTE|nr:MarR family transcriptional regulator [Vagococcus allomyrinae]MBP1042202.1 MarR family transcriptional regulator [Vagococcus allomyrinae]